MSQTVPEKKKIVIKKKSDPIQPKQVLKKVREKLQTLPITIVLAKKESNGAAFKRTHGYSKSMKRNLQKHDLSVFQYSDSLNEYRGICKKRRKALKLIKKEKHNKAVAGRRVKGAKAVSNKKAA